MKAVYKLFSVLTLFGLVNHSPVEASDKKRPVVQMAILLDTSGSMQGLIDQAKSQLWKVVNQFINSKKSGQRPEIQLALYEYGKDTIPANEGHLRQLVPLTSDLDKVSEELFALTTNGGNEYCGRVIQSAVRGLKWSPRAADLKVIFIAGNEPFTQGTLDYHEACKESISRGIVVNTIHCGSEREGVKGNWKNGALLADGIFLNIDHNRKVENISAPQDQKIAKLGQELNATYIAFGRAGKAAKVRQKAQDSNAASVSEEAMAERAVFKSSAAYSNVGWDLVDAQKKGSVKLEDLEEKQLPSEMQKMKPKERKVYLNSMQAKRQEVQEKIRKLQEERKVYVAKKMKERTQSGQDSLDQAMIKSIRKMAVKEGYRFE